MFEGKGCNTQGNTQLHQILIAPADLSKVTWPSEPLWHVLELLAIGFSQPTTRWNHLAGELFGFLLPDTLKWNSDEHWNRTVVGWLAANISLLLE